MSSSVTDNLVVGAGPVGLLMAAFLGAMGQRVTVIEKLEKPAHWSRAIGVSPPSLEILASLHLDKDLIARGHPIERVGVHGASGIRKFLGQVSFSAIPGDYPYMLAVPQEDTEGVLREGLAAYPNVELRYGHELTGISTRKHRQPETTAASNSEPLSGGSNNSAGDPDHAVLTIRRTASADSYQIRAARVFACDGAKSAVRELLGIAWNGHRYPYSFVMGDFQDRSDFGKEARLFFTPTGAVESFPLPRGMRRWIVQTGRFQENANAEFITDIIKQRTGLNVDPGLMTWHSPFGVQRNIASRYREGNFFLLGDAAHIMSPIGGQGMNTGFADAEALARIVEKQAEGAHGAEETEKALVRWEKQRRRAFRVAADRAWRGMRLGTVRGWLAGALRNLVLWVMLNGPFKSRVPLDYAMLTIPHRNLRAEDEQIVSVSGKRKKLA